MISSKFEAVLKGLLALISITCSCISLPKVKLGSSMKLIVFPQKVLMILSAMGRGFRLWFTIEYSCSGPSTSSGLYVAFASHSI